MTGYADYDLFAEVYNRHWGGFGVRVMEPLDRLGLAELQPGAGVLDLCCGTGQLAAGLVERGLRVVGVDGSVRMIEHARSNAPGAEFLVADAREFLLAEPVDMVVSTFDSLNHVMTLDDLGAVFLQTAGALVPGGRFVFDLNMAEGYEARWHGTFVMDEPGEYLVSESSWDAETRIGRMKFTWFAASGEVWQRHELTLTQRCYEESEVLGALTGAGFVEVSAQDAASVAPGWQEGRSFFSATRP